MSLIVEKTLLILALILAPVVVLVKIPCAGLFKN